MSEQVYDFSEWEGSKENIQPLKRGRKPSELRKAFAPLQTIQTNNNNNIEEGTEEYENSENAKKNHLVHDPTVICFDNHNNKVKLNAEREEWELKVGSQMSPDEQDPLLVWIDYLTWIEDNFPTLDKSSKFVETLQRCTRMFVHNERYKTDRRFLLLWLRYTDTCQDPIDVFTYLHTNNIGLDHADLYIAWATVLEDRKDFRAADSVLDQGLKRGAEPLKRLQLCYESFKHRFMQNIMRNPVQQNQQQQQQAAQTENPFGFQRVAFNPMSQAQARSGERPTAMQAPTSMTPIRMTAPSTATTAAVPRSTGFARSRPTGKRPAPASASSIAPSTVKKKALSGNFQIFDETAPTTPSAPPASKKRRVVSNNTPTSIDFGQTSSRSLPFEMPKQQQVPWNYLPSERESEKENQDLPSQWTNYRVSQQQDSLVPSFYSIPPAKEQSISFTVFEDGTEEQDEMSDYLTSQLTFSEEQQ